MTKRPATPSRPLANILDRLLEQAMLTGSPSFRDLAKAAGLDPACDFVGASLRDIDFRDEDLRGFDFSNADLTGVDFRRANVKGVRFKGATLDGAIGLPDPSVQQHEPGVIFVSYSGRDDHPPPDSPNRGGFVSYLLRQVRARLQEDGIPDAILWQDLSRIAPGDDWNEERSNALNNADLFIVILSKNYITSPWCRRELSAIASRAGARVFVVEKHKVPEREVPEPLRRIQSVRFYLEDHDRESVDEFFWGGKVRLSREFDEAVLELTLAIGRRLEERGVPFEPKGQPEPQVDRRSSNGRVVFVAKPALDMVEDYRNLVEELRDTGFRVTPDPDKDLGKLGEEVVSAVVKALAEAEASIHLLGTRRGGRPDGLHMDLVPMQLAAAADEAKRRPGFERMIWAPIALPSGTSAEGTMARRDPLDIVDQFGERVETDQIDGDTAPHFNEFVLRRLATK